MIVVLEGFCGGPRWCAEGARVAGRRLGGLHGCPRGRPTAWVGCGAAWWDRGRSAAPGRGEVLQDLRGPAGLNSWGARRGASTLPSLVVIASVQEEVVRKALRRTIHGSERPSRRSSSCRRAARRLPAWRRSGGESGATIVRRYCYFAYCYSIGTFPGVLAWQGRPQPSICAYRTHPPYYFYYVSQITD